jgi:cytidylate kinase
MRQADYTMSTINADAASPVIAIDGPSASGKGTVAALAAQALGFHYLDSGAIYRVTAYAAQQAGVDLLDEQALAALARPLQLRFDGGEVFLDGQPVGDAIRSEEAGRSASRIAALPALRAALLERQRAFRMSPGLVSDGRDMGSVVFPDASLKVFLTASAEERAKRRYKQLIEKGFDANLAALLQDLKERDARDAARSAAPLQQTADAVLLDTTGLTIQQAVQQVLDWYAQASRAA